MSTVSLFVQSHPQCNLMCTGSVAPLHFHCHAIRLCCWDGKGAQLTDGLTEYMLQHLAVANTYRRC